MGAFRRRPPDDVIPDQWTMLRGQYEGRPLLVRVRSGARKLVGSPRHPIRIGVAIPFRAPTEEGMCSPEELAQLEAFEDALVSRAGGSAVLVAVITTSGTREFVLYTGASEWVAQFHEDLRAALPSHRVDVIAETDPTWSVYLQLCPSS